MDYFRAEEKIVVYLQAIFQNKINEITFQLTNTTRFFFQYFRIYICEIDVWIDCKVDEGPFRLGPVPKQSALFAGMCLAMKIWLRLV